MKVNFLGMVATLAILAGSPAFAGIVYTLTPETIGPLTATGTITTDGNFGVLSAADITALNITISGGSTVVTDNLFSLVGGFGQPAIAFTATSTALLFSFIHDDVLGFAGVGGGYTLEFNS